MARPREFEEEDVLNALRDVFWERGYDGTSYSDIIEATGLQKGSLYAAFGDKRTLYLRALARYDAQEVGAGIRMLKDQSIPAKRRLQNLMQGPIDAAGTKQGRWGCMLCNAAVDQAPVDPQTETAVVASMERFKDAIDVTLKDLPSFARSPRKRFDKATSLLAGYFGLRVLVKAGLPRDLIIGGARDILDF
jgi:TetR/AcrR family transcriptional repressor of nem operon